MTSVWTRKVHADTPLPKAFETSLRVAVASYQGTLTLSLSQLTREAGRPARVRPLWTETADYRPEDYREALRVIHDFVNEMLAKLESEGVG